VTGVLWAIEVLDMILGGALDAWGVHPWSLEGLSGILFAPLLHADFGHLIANTLGLVPLGLMTMARKQQDFWVVTVVSALTAGLGAWIFGHPSEVHLGASGVIFGYLGFLIGRGWYDRRPMPVLMSLFTVWLYGGMVWGIFPSGLPISWQSHLFGFFGGLLVARTLGRELAARR
jgi:membrane associated rhomboid family serine protease